MLGRSGSVLAPYRIGYLRPEPCGAACPGYFVYALATRLTEKDWRR